MTAIWVAYLLLAERLVNLAADPTISPAEREAMLRSAISRAYYAAFILTHNYLRDQEGDKAISKLSQVHLYAADKFSGSKNQLRHDIGTKLYRLRRMRNSADYDDRFDKLPRDARRAVNEAKLVVGALNSLR